MLDSVPVQHGRWVAYTTTVRDACDQLRERGILEYDRRLDITFSRAGTSLGKKLVAKWEG
jgi:Mn-dependent DtxR family transcriptional regulator